MISLRAVSVRARLGVRRVIMVTFRVKVEI